MAKEQDDNEIGEDVTLSTHSSNPSNDASMPVVTDYEVDNLHEVGDIVEEEASVRDGVETSEVVETVVVRPPAKTRLVSDFRTLTNAQAAYLVSHRETATASRSPLFYGTLALIALSVLVSLIIGVTHNASSTDGLKVAVANVEQKDVEAFAAETQIDMVAVESPDQGEAMLRSGEVSAVLILEMGQVPPTILALDREPTALLDKLAPAPPVTLLESPPVPPQITELVGWGMAALLIAAVITLGVIVYQNLRTEKRNRITEVIAATIPARASVWGRINGLTVLSLSYLVVAASLFLLGLSLTQRTQLALSLLPGIAWFAIGYGATVFLFLAIFVWVSSAAGRRLRRSGYGLTILLVLFGAITPMVLRSNGTVLQWLSYVPFSSPVALALREFAGKVEWWEALASLAGVVLCGLLASLIATHWYGKNMLRGAGRTGRKTRMKKIAEAGEREPAPAASTQESVEVVAKSE